MSAEEKTVEVLTETLYIFFRSAILGIWKTSSLTWWG